MDNKTKVKVAVVIGIVVLAVIFIFMVVFVKGNKTPVNKNIPTKGEEGYKDPTTSSSSSSSGQSEEQPGGEQVALDNIVSVAVKNGSLVKINADLTSTEIRKMENGYTQLCYGEGNVYAVVNNGDSTYSIIEIALNKSNYPEKTILSTADYGSIHNLEYYSGKLYFVSQIGQLIEYSISENYSKALSNAGEVSNFIINANTNNMYVSYMPNGQNAGVYILDFTSNSFTQIIALTELPGQLILNGTHLVIDVKELGSLYIFDMEANSVVGIGPENSNLKEIKNQVAFYDNVLLYTNGSAIDLKKISGESYQDSWYTLNDSSIADIAMIDASKMQIARFDGSGSGQITRSILIDLSTGNTTEVPDYAYTDVIRLEK